MVLDIKDLQNELRSSPKPEFAGTKKPRQRKTTARSTKTPAPTASTWISLIAEDWMSRAKDAGFEPPYNTNFLANAMEAKVSRDTWISDLDEDRRNRLVAKMVELFWKTDWEDGWSYVREGDTSSRIKDVFLNDCWNDLRQVSYDSLRAKYLKEHGRVVPRPEYLEQADTEMHKMLRKARDKDFLAREMAAREDVRELHRLDEETRALLSSAKDRKADR